MHTERFLSRRPFSPGPFSPRTLCAFLLLLFLFPAVGTAQISVEIDTTIADKNCGDFQSILAAQGTYVAVQWLVQDSTADPFQLDADGDGIACAGKDIVRRVAPGDTTGFWYDTAETVEEARCPAVGEPFEVGEVLDDVRGLPREVMADSTEYARLQAQVTCLRNLGLLSEEIPLPAPPPPDTSEGGGGPSPGSDPSFRYAEECSAHVNNATIYAPGPKTLPTGEPVAEGDTIALVTPRGNCAGAIPAGTDGKFALAAASKNDFSGLPDAPGLNGGESFHFEVYNRSDSLAYSVWPTFASCSGGEPPICRDDGQYEDGAFFQVEALESEP